MRPIETLRNKGVAPAMLEVGLIVFGLLVALGLQSWWEGRVERNDLRAYLVAFEQEIIRNDAEIDNYFKIYSGTLLRLGESFDSV